MTYAALVRARKTCRACPGLTNPADCNDGPKQGKMYPAPAPLMAAHESRDCHSRKTELTMSPTVPAFIPYLESGRMG